jgi:phosphoglycolate phosphatase-like HAD superfamily hydrolase
MFGVQDTWQNMETKGEWVTIPSSLFNLKNEHSQIKIEIMGDGKPRAMAFFDIDGTLAELGMVHGKAIELLFPDADPEELKETYYRGFKLGNSFREFDRMKGIFIDEKKEWKDPEYYFKNRFLPKQKEIDEAGNREHEMAEMYLNKYGSLVAKQADEIYERNPEAFEKASIQPIFHLAKIYSRLGVPMVGFTANAKVLVDKLAKYLKLSDLFLDIATDETMVGGGKEVAIHYLLVKIKEKGILIPKERLVFVGDSIRGDIGISMLAKHKDSEIHGQGILVLKNKKDLIEIKKQIDEDPEINKLVRSIDIHALIVEEVPTDEHGKPMLLLRDMEKFWEKL